MARRNATRATRAGGGEKRGIGKKARAQSERNPANQASEEVSNGGGGDSDRSTEGYPIRKIPLKIARPRLLGAEDSEGGLDHISTTKG